MTNKACMTTICKNCNNQFEGNFCNNCGQAANTHKLNMHFIWHDLKHGLFHFDNGIFYTIAQLLTKPGYTIREIIDGKRVKHFKPLSFIVVLATVYGLLYHFFINNLYHVKPINANEDVISAFVFKKQGRNFAEPFSIKYFLYGLNTFD